MRTSRVDNCMVLLGVALIVACFMACCTIRAGEPDCRAQVAVALALSGTKTAAQPAADNGCGVCRDDYVACWDDAIKTGKPLVLFVGGCEGRAKQLTGMVPCRVKEFKGDGRVNHAAPRIVVIKKHHDGLYHAHTVEKDMPTKVVQDLIGAPLVAPLTVGPQRVQWQS